MFVFIKKNKIGMTVIEVLVAMAVFAIISVPLMGIFIDSMAATKLAQDRIETNALVSIVKDSVTNDVKITGTGHLKDLSGADIKLNNISGPSITTGSAYDLQIRDEKDVPSTRYKFDAVRISDFGTVSTSSITTTDPIKFPDTCEYALTIRNIYNNMAVQKFNIYINKVQPVVIP